MSVRVTRRHRLRGSAKSAEGVYGEAGSKTVANTETGRPVARSCNGSHRSRSSSGSSAQTVVRTKGRTSESGQKKQRGGQG